MFITTDKPKYSSALYMYIYTLHLSSTVLVCNGPAPLTCIYIYIPCFLISQCVSVCFLTWLRHFVSPFPLQCGEKDEMVTELQAQVTALSSKVLSLQSSYQFIFMFFERRVFCLCTVCVD